MTEAGTPVDFATLRMSLETLARHTLVPEVQVEVAKIAKIVARLEANDNSSANADIALAMRALEADTPNLTLARELRYATKMRTGAFRNGRTAWFMRLTGGSATAVIVIGLISAFLSWVIIGPVLLWLFRNFENRSLTYFPLNELTTIVIAALLGALVSIMIRLRDVAEPDEFNPGLLFLSAYFKPFIGVIVAIFAYAALKSEIISSSLISGATSDEMQNGVYWVVSFICGFSERFALGLVGNVEGKLSGREPAGRRDDTVDSGR
tara:strand:+ start:22233 stop:23027 length:795 start_codon:yes stop_codon:yes gene_type:complete